jgi:hypothetical protein
MIRSLVRITYRPGSRLPNSTSSASVRLSSKPPTSSNTYRRIAVMANSVALDSPTLCRRQKCSQSVLYASTRLSANSGCQS